MKPENGENTENRKYILQGFCFVKQDDNKMELFRLSIQCKQRHIFLDSDGQLMLMVSGHPARPALARAISKLYLTAKCLQFSYDTIFIIKGIQTGEDFDNIYPTDYISLFYKFLLGSRNLFVSKRLLQYCNLFLTQVHLEIPWDCFPLIHLNQMVLRGNVSARGF